MNNDNPSYLNLRLFNDNFDEEDDDKSDNSLGLKDLHETTTIEPVDVDVEPITPPDFIMAAVTKDDIKTLLESHETKKLSTIQPKTFSGRVDENPHNFMSHFEAYAKLTSLEGETKCLTFNLMLQDVALCWYESLSDDKGNDFDVALKLESQDTVQHLDTMNHLVNVETARIPLQKQQNGDREMEYNAAHEQQQNVPSRGCYICGKNHHARHCWYRPGRGQLHRQLPNHQYERPWRPRNNRFQQQIDAQQFEQQQQDAYENNQPQPWNEAVSND